jgi:serine/threonine-protein kinase RsbW
MPPRGDGPDVSFRLRACLEQRSMAIDLVSAVLGHVRGADRNFRHEFVTAFGEAFNNIVIHGYRGRTDGLLDVDVELVNEGVTMRLKDHGHPVDLESVEPPDLESMPERGMGVFMIHALIDEVAYERGNPNVLSLTKRVTPENACGGRNPR